MPVQSSVPRNCRQVRKEGFCNPWSYIDDPSAVEEFREDLRFGKRLRKYSDYGTMALIAAIFIALGAALWAGIVTRISGK